MSHLPQDRQYTREDVWLRPEGGDLYTLGLTDTAQAELGELVFVELPEPGRTLGAGATLAVVESVKSVSEVRCPSGGVVIETNQTLMQTPETINESPFEEGWIARLRFERAPDDVLSPAQYAAWRRLDAK